jgi:hypothetical protein
METPRDAPHGCAEEGRAPAPACDVAQALPSSAAPQIANVAAAPQPAGSDRARKANLISDGGSMYLTEMAPAAVGCSTAERRRNVAGLLECRVPRAVAVRIAARVPVEQNTVARIASEGDGPRTAAPAAPTILAFGKRDESSSVHLGRRRGDLWMREYSARILVSSSVSCSLSKVIKGPEGPEPALGFFEKKPGLSPKNLESHVDMSRSKQAKQQKFSPNEPGGRANVFFVYVIIITLTLRFRLRYVNVAGATFSFTLRYRIGRETYRGSR